MWIFRVRAFQAEIAKRQVPTGLMAGMFQKEQGSQYGWSQGNKEEARNGKGGQRQNMAMSHRAPVSVRTVTFILDEAGSQLREPTKDRCGLPYEVLVFGFI